MTLTRKNKLKKLGLSYRKIGIRIGKSRMQVWRVIHKKGEYSRATAKRVQEVIEEAKHRKKAA